VRELRSEAGEEEKALFDEFEKILSAVGRRLEEGLREAEALLNQTAEQLLVLLAVDPGGLVSRTLTERIEQVESVFGIAFDDLLARLHGSATAGYVSAGASYVASGYYREGILAFEAARARGGNSAELSRRTAYARGMAAYLVRDYPETVAALREWSGYEDDDSAALKGLARDALARIGQLVTGGDRDRLVAEAEAILAQLPADAKFGAGGAAE
jgi:hypothetical protein